LTPAERVAWLQILINAAESAVASLRVRDEGTRSVLIADLDDLCTRLRGELDDLR
jgi:hypothetical protein